MPSLTLSPLALLWRSARSHASLLYLLLPHAPSLPIKEGSLFVDDRIRPDAFHETKRIIRDFLSGLGFRSPRTPKNFDLRQQLTAEIASWNIDVSTTFTEKMLHNSCNMAECCYSHESPEHQYFIALYTAFTFYADDHCGADPEPIGQFAQRCLEGAPQLDPVLDRFAAHLNKTFGLWPRIGANAIISGTFDSMTAMYIEYTTKDMATRPGATRYPYYVRTKSGVGPPYAHFIFPSAWRSSVNSYIQIIPELDYFINCTNDLLSFYKESLAGETDNYVHLRASAERKSPTDVLRTLAAEVTDTVERIDAITSIDPELAALWQRFLQGYLEFHVKTTRYRLAELDFYA
ncbi:terpenoid synthase [Dichomitus squalens LYAD-421 SS1]|uniref:Terpenoid synthase n=1 Tax=Dichomitus squalens (strain LYAD-421) TaxID=732165 RepID=R7SYK5_DICSQ|nr:terpenoid synthase [Dichomitus squalens LYAD-421 SS1]EJF61156.1 terpenoid synthase [Dichomitus squalens LYAD-421 SS1]